MSNKYSLDVVFEGETRRIEVTESELEPRLADLKANKLVTSVAIYEMKAVEGGFERPAHVKAEPEPTTLEATVTTE